jgi:hypothetical protein
MTYRIDCGGEKFFRNRRSQCGEDKVRSCRCGNAQNSHEKLLSVFGEGTPITPPPHATIGFPAMGSMIGASSVVHILAGSQRGVAHVELYLNGSRWAVLAGQAFGAAGQADPGDYTFQLPPKVPDGLIDIKGIAYDDLGLAAETETVTVVKGEACTSDSTCLKDQSCDAGHCTWPPPEGELGASCSYDQQCTSWTCLGAGDDKYCTTPCYTDEPSTCPTDYTCVGTGNLTDGYCLPDSTGCCSVGGDSGRHLWVHVLMSVLVLTWLRRRKR